jgi:hypothetical protein
MHVVRLWAIPGEDEIGGDVDHPRTDSRRRLGEVARAIGIDAECGLWLGLRQVHLGVRGGIDDHGRPQLSHDEADGRGIADIQRRLVDRHEFDTDRDPPRKRRAELTGGANQQNLHG